MVLELVEGDSLEVMIRAGKLDLPRIVDIVAQITDGLAAAHRAGIVHRDIKPANILIDSDGRVRVLDFGLAKSRRATTETRVGTTVGTVYYESPEQSTGRDVDARSDLFSLGVVFYELVAGRRPFEGDFADAVRYAIGHDAPEPLSRYKSDVPPALRDVVSRLLEKDPDRRYQTAGDLRADLRRLAGSPAAAAPLATTPAQDRREESVVVLPFENLSPDPDNEYFSDGLTEEIITDLGKIKAVRTISRKSAMKLKGTDKDVRTLGRELGVQYVLSGSVRKAGNSLRVNAELVEASTDRQMWADRFSGTVEDVFEIQEKVARAIAGALKVWLSATDDADLKRRPVSDMRAYDLYMRARQETERWDLQGLDRANEYLRKALEIEPDNPLLQTAMGYNYYNYVNMGFHQDDSVSEALRYVRKALELDPDSIDARRLQGVIGLSLAGEGPLGLKRLEAVLECAPEDTEAMWWLSIGSGFVGRPQRGIELAERLIQLDPLVTFNYLGRVWAYFMAGDIARAVEHAEALSARDSQHMLGQFSRGQVMLYAGRFEEAEQFIRQVEARPPAAMFDRLLLAQLYARRGDRAMVEKTVTEEVKRSARRDFQYSWHLAVAHTLLGDHDVALDWLTTAVNNGFINYRFLSESDPFLVPLRKEPRFVELMNRARTQLETAS
jgi:TolB-like protein